MRAIAGTRPRGSDEEKDKQLAGELKKDEKELAEHMMLVDLGRNDLGRICKAGSIAVGEIACPGPSIHTSCTCSLRLPARWHQTRLVLTHFAAAFPAGTVSGAPKIRAMQLLSHLEPELRGIYSGAVGYFDFIGNMDGAIAIRSALVKDNTVHVNAGGGIVYDSDPLGEYNETRNKAKSLLQAVKLAEATGR